MIADNTSDKYHEPMIISANQIIGSLVYRTREALNGNPQFLQKLGTYYYAHNCLEYGKFSLRHFPGTFGEIAGVLQQLDETANGSKWKFPALLNFQSIKQQKKGNAVTAYYSLAVVGSVKSEWSTQERENEVFDKVLRPICDEFINQIQQSGFFQLEYGNPAHDYYEVFTTGGNSAQLKDLYGECTDAIELHNLALTFRPALCGQHLRTIEKENNLVTESITNILNL